MGNLFQHFIVEMFCLLLLASLNIMSRRDKPN